MLSHILIMGRSGVRPAAGLIVLILFGLFTWGFSYNMLIQVGFAEQAAQLSGLILGLTSIVAVEGFVWLKRRVDRSR